ncbi:MAG: LytR C-terminal domain-containing protein [Gemmatimonas sp.]
MRRTRVVVIGLIALVAVGASAIVQMRTHRDPAAPPPPRIRAPDSVRIRVQVLNATKVHGLARRATMLLRDRGFDVVETGNVNDMRDTTVVLDLSNHPEWAARVARLFGTARVETRHDSSRYLDIAVVLGSTWRPPAEPFYP